jgi:hypothetical protein
MAVLIVMMLTLFSAGAIFAADTSSAEISNNAGSPESVHAILSGLSDEQVRQMLIAELKKDAAADDKFSLEPAINGPGAPLSRMLRAFNNESVQSEHDFEKLWAGIPNVLPDLFKVFISL